MIESDFIEDGIPVFNIVFLCFKQVGGVVVGGNGSDLVTLFDLIYDVLSVGNLTEHRVFSIQMWGGVVGDEKLGSIRASTGVGHGEYAGRAMAEFGMELVCKLVTRAPAAGARGVAPLDHEVCNDAVEADAVVITPFGEVEEVRAGEWCFRGIHGRVDVSCGGVDCYFDVFHKVFSFEVFSFQGRED